MAFEDNLQGHVLLMNEPALFELMNAPFLPVGLFVKKKTHAIYEEVKRRCPKHTGALEETITEEVIGTTGFVFSDSPYVLFVHDGTLPHPINANAKQALYWEGADHPVRSVMHPGSRPNPFFLEALVAEMLT